MDTENGVWYFKRSIQTGSCKVFNVNFSLHHFEIPFSINSKIKWRSTLWKKSNKLIIKCIFYTNKKSKLYFMSELRTTIRNETIFLQVILYNKASYLWNIYRYLFTSKNQNGCHLDEWYYFYYTHTHLTPIIYEYLN